MKKFILPALVATVLGVSVIGTSTTKVEAYRIQERVVRRHLDVHPRYRNMVRWIYVYNTGRIYYGHWMGAA